MLPPPTGLSSNLPIIQKATEAYKLWHVFHNKFPRLSKFSLGGKIDVLFVDLLENLIHARYEERRSKIEYVIAANTKLDLLKFFIQISWEIGVLEHKQFAAISILLDEIGRMIGGWQKQLQT